MGGWNHDLPAVVIALARDDVTTSGSYDDVRALVADEPVRPDDRAELAGWMEKLARAAARDLQASGVGVSICPTAGKCTVLAASSVASHDIAQLQFTLGEGPCTDALVVGRPMITPDLSAVPRDRWPGYATAAHEHGVRAVFAFPLQVGAAQVGVMDVHREQVGALAHRHLSRALAFAELALVALLDAQERSAPGPGPELGVSLLAGHHLLYQAQGMVMVQLGVSLGEALVRLRSRAYADNRPLKDVAADVIARRLVFEPDS